MKVCKRIAKFVVRSVDMKHLNKWALLTSRIMFQYGHKAFLMSCYC